MNITQLKQMIEANLAGDAFILNGVALSNENVSQFLSGLPFPLQFTSRNSVLSAGDTWLQVQQNLGGDWNLSGLTAGVLQQTAFSFMLTEGAAAIEAQLALSGSFNVPSLNHLLPIKGSMSDLAGRVVILEITTGDLPTFTEIAQSVGLGQVTQSFADLNLEMPTVTAVRFGYDMQAKGLTFTEVDGSLRFGNGVLNVSCLFAPDLTITGSLPEGGGIGLADIFTTLGLDASNLPDSGISTLDFHLTPVSKTYSLAIGLQNNWSIDLGGTALTIAQVGVAVGRAADVTTATLNGEIALDETALVLTANRNDEGNWDFSGALAEGSTVRLRSVINTFLPGALELPDEVPDMACKAIALTFMPASGDLSFHASSAEPWDIPVGVEGLSISGINLNINRSQDENDQSQVTGLIGGTLNIGAANSTATYTIPGDFVLAGDIPSFKLSPLLQDVCGGDAVRGVPVPAGVLDVELRDLAFSIAPQKREMAFSADSDFGQSEIQVKRMTTGTWGFTVGFVPPEQWKFSTLDASLSVLDGLKFADTALILASSEDRSFELVSIETPRDDVSIKRGLNLFASLSMAGLGVDELLKIESLMVYAAIGSDPRNLTLEAQIEGEFEIEKNVAFGDIKFRLQVSPPNFGVTLLGRIRAILDGSELNFIGGLGIQAITAPPSFQARMLATMQGRWQDPLGAKGVAIMDVALDLGLAFPPIRPSIGIAGGLQVGEFIGAAAVKFDTAQPGNTMVAIAFNELYLIDIFKVFCPPEVQKVIPKSISKTVLDVGFEDVSIYIVPQPTNIGELFFEQGIALKGTMDLWGLRAFASLKIDQTRGILVEGDVDEINLAGIFKLTGAGARPKASLLLDLRTGATPTIDISGAVELLGMRSETVLQISDKDFHFLTIGRIFDLFEASLDVRGGDLLKGDSVFVKATMKNDLFAYLREKVTKEIEAAANDAMNKIGDAQRKLTTAQKEVNKLNQEIEAMRNTIRQERDRDAARLKAAQQAVTAAQKEVNRINSEITRMRSIVRAERDRDAARLRSARQAVTNAQTEVNRLQREINSTKARIDQLNRDIAAKRRWYDNSAWYQKTYRWAEFSAYAAAKGAEIGALYTKIGGLEAAKHTAIGVLEVAKQALRGMEAAATAIPIDADPRVAALFTARTAANGTLELAKKTLRGLELAARTFPIDADPRIVALFTARETANGALQAAKLALEGVKLAVGAAAEAAAFIARFGLGGLIDIREARFEGSLNATRGGRVSLAVKLSFMNKSKAFAFAFNFHDPLSGAKELAKILLPA